MKSNLRNDRFLQALKCQNTSGRPPVWLMRQAGRHLASYRHLRERHSFLEMCHSSELINEVTLLPVKAYEVDAAILFSDILMIPEAMGVGLHFEEEKGPVIERPLSNIQEVKDLPPPNPEAFKFIQEGIGLLKTSLDIPLIGFSGAPFTLASYMIEGKTSRDLKKTKQWLFSDPEGFHLLLRKIADWTVSYLQLQIEAGVDAIQIFDSWANVLAYRQFREYSLYYMDYILKRLQPSVPVILFCRGSSVFAEELAQIHPAGISLDWNCSLPAVRKAIPKTIALQGNLDPDIMYAPLPKIKEEAFTLLEAMKEEKGFIFSLGHGLFPDVKEESVRTLIECIRS